MQNMYDFMNELCPIIMNETDESLMNTLKSII